MRKEKFTWIDLLIIVIFIVVVYMLLTRIFGHSATDLAITIGLFAVLFVNQYKLNREVGEIRLNMKHGFHKVKEDILAMKEDLSLIKKKLKV